jgi:hypothetical protein
MARAFTARGDKIDCGNGASLTVAAFTLSCWTYIPTLTFTGTNTSFAFMCGKNDATSSGAYCIYVGSTGKVHYTFATGGTGHSVDGSHVLSINTWYNIISTYNSVAGLVGYVGAASDGTIVAAGSIGGATSHFQMGDDFANPSVFNSTARIANVGLWNTVLAAGEVGALANGALPLSIRQGNLVGNWPVDGLQSPEPDLSGNANNGTLTGTALAAGPPVMPFTPRWPMGAILPFNIAVPSAGLFSGFASAEW